MTFWQWLGGVPRRAACDHAMVDGYAFASCVEITIPTGGRRPVSWQIMQFCIKCDHASRRRLTAEEWEGWRADLTTGFYAGYGHRPIERALAGETGTGSTEGESAGPEGASPKPSSHHPGQ